MADWREIAAALRPTLRVRTVQGEPLLIGKRQIVPVMRSVSFTLGRPGGPLAAGFVRNSPVAVLETWRGQTRRIPIPDVTRRAILALGAAGLLLMLGASYLRRQNKHNQRRIVAR